MFGFKKNVKTFAPEVIRAINEQLKNAAKCYDSTIPIATRVNYMVNGEYMKMELAPGHTHMLKGVIYDAFDATYSIIEQHPWIVTDGHVNIGILSVYANLLADERLRDGGYLYNEAMQRIRMLEVFVL